MLAFLNVFLSATQEGLQERKGKYEDYISTRRTVTSKYFLRKHLRMYVLCLHHQLHSLLPARHFVFSAWLCQRYLVRKLKVPAKWEPSLKCCYLKCHAVRAVCTHHTHYSMLDFTSLPFTFFFFLFLAWWIYFFLLNLSLIQPLFSIHMTRTLTQALIISCLDNSSHLHSSLNKYWLATCVSFKTFFFLLF